MEAAPVVTLIAVGLAIAVIAAFLITVIYQLANVFSRLNTILGVVGTVCEKTEVLDPIISEISADLGAGHEALGGAVERLKVRKGYAESAPPAEHELDREPAGVGTSTPVEPPPSVYRNY
ncbi:MAG: hypothetical protein ACLGI5_08080 [Thermoleophilia bacterium]